MTPLSVGDPIPYREPDVHTPTPPPGFPRRPVVPDPIPGRPIRIDIGDPPDDDETVH